MTSELWNGQSFSVSHADGTGTFPGGFEGGLRSFFEYRDLGVKKATNGKYLAHVIRAVPGNHTKPQWHTHNLDFQMVFVLKGWVKFEYEGQGEITLRSGSSTLQPPGIKHREISHSDDLELIEICSPGDFETELSDHE
jgi:mannose-6-phosphate isomerase-like protein (cupin superfamily)